MSSVVFILGAGASRECGAPLMGDFLDVASDLLSLGLVKDKESQFRKVFSAIGSLQSVHSKAWLDLANIESIFTALELGSVIRKIPGLPPDEIRSTISALKDLIVRTLELKIPFPSRNGHIHAPEPYARFSELIERIRVKARPHHSVSVMTFNYDIAVDMGIFRAGLGPDYIIDRPVYVQDSVPLMKLHGSLNWASEVSTRSVRPLHLHSYFEKYPVAGKAYSEIFMSFGDRLVEYFEESERLVVSPEPVIVPPSWNKADYHHALSDIWSAAAGHLSEAQYVFVMGYSLPMTDSFFRHLYALGSVGEMPLRKFVVYNPDKTGAVDERFRALLGPGALYRYEYCALPFLGAIAHVKKFFDLV